MLLTLRCLEGTEECVRKLSSLERSESHVTERRPEEALQDHRGGRCRVTCQSAESTQSKAACASQSQMRAGKGICCVTHSTHKKAIFDATGNNKPILFSIIFLTIKNPQKTR